MYGKALMIKPMKIWQLPKNKKHMKDVVCASGDYFAQLKKDGYWYMFEKDMEGNCFLFSRVESVQTGFLSEKSANVPHIVNFLNSRLPNGTILIGEIYYPNGTSKNVTSIMGCDPEKAVERQKGEYGFIHYYLHDMLMYGGKSLLNETNWCRYNTLLNLYCFNELGENPSIELAEAFTDKLSARIDKAFEDGEEGMVLKRKDGKYCSGKKPAWEMIKFKIEDECDVVCMGFEEPTHYYTGKDGYNWNYWRNSKGQLRYSTDPKLDLGGVVQEGTENIWTAESNEGILMAVTKPNAMGWVGAIKMGAYKDGFLIDIGTVSSGLTDALCEEIKENPDKFTGQPMAVKCMMVSDGALRHPALVRFRDDINATDCTYDKIFN